MDNPDNSKNETIAKIEFLAAPGENEGVAKARAAFCSAIPSAVVAQQWIMSSWGNDVDLASTVVALTNSGKKVNAGDLSEVEAALANQATALNAIFTNLSCRARRNVEQYPEAFEMYMKLALKAQNQARMTLETLANVKNPPVVYAKQANITNGPQQVNNTLHAPARETETPPSKLVEHSNETPMDTTAAGSAGNQDTQMATVDALNRPENS